jgi:hypothetical protein
VRAPALSGPADASQATQATAPRTVPGAEGETAPGTAPASRAGRADHGGDDELVDLLDPEVLAAETEPAGAGLSPEERLKQAFPGAQEV